MFPPLKPYVSPSSLLPPRFFPWVVHYSSEYLACKVSIYLRSVRRTFSHSFWIRKRVGGLNCKRRPSPKNTAVWKLSPCPEVRRSLLEGQAFPRTESPRALEPHHRCRTTFVGRHQLLTPNSSPLPGNPTVFSSLLLLPSPSCLLNSALCGFFGRIRPFDFPPIADSYLWPLD